MFQYSRMIPALAFLLLAAPVGAAEFTFAPAPVTGDLIGEGESKGNIRFTYLTVDSKSTTITGLGASTATRKRFGSVLGMNFAGNFLALEDDENTFSGTTVNAMIGPDFYLSSNIIAFADVSLGQSQFDFESGSSTFSSTTDISGYSYGIQINLGSRDFMVTPYFMALEQTASTDNQADVDLSSSVVGVDILIGGASLAALFQSTDDTDIVMFSIGTSF